MEKIDKVDLFVVIPKNSRSTQVYGRHKSSAQVFSTVFFHRAFFHNENRLILSILSFTSKTGAGFSDKISLMFATTAAGDGKSDGWKTRCHKVSKILE